MEKKQKKKTSLVTTFIIGGAVGSVLGLLFAPKKGEQTRADIREKATEVFQKPKETLKKDGNSFLEKMIIWLEKE